MLDLEFALLAALAVGLVLGCCGVYWARAGWGRVLFVLVLVFLASCALLAAALLAEALVPLGLAAGGLLVAMLWEAPGVSVPLSEET